MKKESTSSRISRALDFGRAAHAGQVRKYTNEPYWTHPVAVAEIVSEHGGTEDMVIAALLHDTIEDTDVRYADIYNEFGKEVADLVWELTDVFTPENFPQFNRKTRKHKECERLAKISERAKRIKVADLIHNTASIEHHDPKFAKVYLKEKAAVMEVISGKYALPLEDV